MKSGFLFQGQEVRQWGLSSQRSYWVGELSKVHQKHSEWASRNDARTRHEKPDFQDWRWLKWDLKLFVIDDSTLSEGLKANLNAESCNVVDPGTATEDRKNASFSQRRGPSSHEAKLHAAYNIWRRASHVDHQWHRTLSRFKRQLDALSSYAERQPTDPCLLL